MNMVDTKKCFRGVLLWREDVIKCARCVRKPLSTFVRELLHAEMEKHRLQEDGNRILRMQISEALEARKRKSSDAKRKTSGKRVLVTDRIKIPRKTLEAASFVRG